MATDPETSETSRRRRLLARFPRAAPLVMFALIAAITALGVLTIEQNENDAERLRLVRAANSLGATLERRAATSSSYLRAGAALFATTGDMDPVTFRRFVGELQLELHNNYFEEIEQEVDRFCALYDIPEKRPLNAEFLNQLLEKEMVIVSLRII